MTNEELIRIASFMARPLECLGLDIRTFNALKRKGINDIYEIYLVGKDLMKIRNFGYKSMCDVQMCLEIKGIPKIEVEE